MTNARRLMAASVAAAAILVGCGRSEPDQSSPAGAMEKFALAELGITPEPYLACVTGEEDQIRAVTAMFDYRTAARAFRQTLEWTRGQDGWEAFAPGAEAVDWNPSDLYERIDRLQIDVQGDAATASLPDGGRTYPLVRKDGRWYVQAAGLLPTDRTAHASARMYTRLSEMLRIKSKKIAREEYPPKDLGKEVGDEAYRIKKAR